MGNITYIRIKGGWCYLEVVLNLYAQYGVGFSGSGPLTVYWQLKDSSGTLKQNGCQRVVTRILLIVTLSNF